MDQEGGGVRLAAGCMVLVSDTAHHKVPMRLKLSHDSLQLHKPALTSQERLVYVERQKGGSLGFSIKGGAEHKVPILISRVHHPETTPSTLFVGDAILKVNEVSLERASHDEALGILRCAGEKVALLVKHYKASVPFLSPEGPPPEYWRLLKEDTGPPRLSGYWLSIPLLMAYFSRYMADTDKLRKDAFEVQGREGRPSVVIQCDDSLTCAEWTLRLDTAIRTLGIQEMESWNQKVPPTEQVVYMGWVSEGLVAPQPCLRWVPRFLALRGGACFLFDCPPRGPEGFATCSCTYRIYQVLLRVIKEGEGRDNRQPCVVVQTSPGCGHYLCCQSEQELARLEAAWQRCTHVAVARLGSKTFPVSHQGQPAALTLDWVAGCFSLFDPQKKVTLWKYKFSQLKSSSDDGSSKVQLSFQEGSQLLIKELECQSLCKLLCCMHAFLTAKLASLDPAFLSPSH